MKAREAIYSALFAKVSGVAGLKTASRKLRHWSDVSNADKPALFMTQGSEDGAAKFRLETIWTLHATLYLYIHQINIGSDVPATALNNFVDAIEVALAPDSTGAQTLGGLVQHATIAGKLETDEGVLGDEAVAIIPIVIVANA